GPMDWVSIGLKPSRSQGVDPVHISNCFVKIVLRCSSSCFPEQRTQICILEGFTETFFKMLEAISMRTVRKNRPHGFKKALLTIREKGKRLGTKVIRRMRLNHTADHLKKPEPIVVVLRIDNSIC